ncbi:Elongator complex protein 1 [Pleurotus eryngii]|uniref:Elongator complex protein 1 n=1 Tax=Pleurotus eryngii TaxID=5323 RepID=A0A9P5ZUF7_PLEER|nr:Elongator complex protein 1 [Pleurotus eryngii]
MRNLSLSSTSETILGDSIASVTAIDLDKDAVYIASISEDATVIEIRKLDAADARHNAHASLLNVIEANVQRPTEITSFRFLPDSRKLILILSGGDMHSYSVETDEAEVEGSIEAGILSADWSPDDELLSLITGDEKLILMTSAFDVLSEAPLHTADYGEDAPINVGWGSKQTQFHGSLGKAAAHEKPATNVSSSPDDDQAPHISWRGDGSYFVVSAFFTPHDTGLPRRVLRVFDRHAKLQATMDPIPGLEHPLAWRPSGNLIASTQRFGFEGGGAGKSDRHDVVFFERNGLRHGEFSLRFKNTIDEGALARKWGYNVRDLAWSSDSSVLAVWIEHEKGDTVQLWTIGNYHWYLKHEIISPTWGYSHSRFTSMSWHPERSLCLHLTTHNHFVERTYTWDTSSSHSQPPNDTGSVAVIDGSKILLTPFRMQNVPPPMSSLQLDFAGKTSLYPVQVPVHTAFCVTKDILAVLWESGFVEIWSLNTRLEQGYGPVMKPSQARQIVAQEGLDNTLRLLILGVTDNGMDVLVDVSAEGGAVNAKAPQSIGTRSGRLITTDAVARDGSQPVARFPEFCFSAQLVSASDTSDRIIIGHAGPAKLYAAGHDRHVLLASNATSYTVGSGYIIFTTSAHECIFIPLSALPRLLEDAGKGRGKLPEWEKRRVERGSRIVVVVPSSMSLVLQMPRGNLETINPRPLVMEVVRQDIKRHNYRKAFLACRKHRIDFSVIVESNQQDFLENLPVFLEQVHEVDYINLFLTTISRGSLSPEVTTRVCDRVQELLSTTDLNKYVNAILTARVVKSPPDHEGALGLLPKLRSTNPELVEEAVKYVIFLVDAEKLFDIALGMYDFSLVLMIAQHAQKDPREYLPFLRELRALETNYQRFKIDDHLKRYTKALKNLSFGGGPYFDEAKAYIEKHQLHEAALAIWRNTDQYNTVLELYGDWLFERREFHQAAAAFVEATNLPKALVAYERALEWQELFDIAIQCDAKGEGIKDLAYRVAEELTSKKRHAEAATVLADYAKDTREAVIALVQGNYFAEAKRITSLHGRPELVKDVVHPGALESRSQLSDDLTEMRDQLRKQLNRIRELRIKKQEEPDAFYGVEDSNLANVDVMTDVSMAPTAFTRYTVAPSMASRASKISSRSKRKAERKIGSGRKGTVDEEEYLLNSITKLVARFQTVQREAHGLLPFLFQFSTEHREEGLELQKEVSEFEEELLATLEDIWAKPKTDPDNPDGSNGDTWATRMEEIEKRRLIEPTAKITKPDLRKGDWRLRLFDVTGK